MHQGLIKAGQHGSSTTSDGADQSLTEHFYTCLDPHRPGPSGEGDRTREKREGGKARTKEGCSRSYTKKSTKLKNKSPVFTGINKLNSSWK